MIKEEPMDLSNLFMVKTPKDDTTVLIRLGRITHYTLSTLGLFVLVFAIGITVSFWNEFGHPPAFFSGELVFALLGVFNVLLGRGIRYVLSGE
jgi:uncharacterized membrane protein YczE